MGGIGRMSNNNAKMIGERKNAADNTITDLVEELYKHANLNPNNCVYPPITGYKLDVRYHGRNKKNLEQFRNILADIEAHPYFDRKDNESELSGSDRTLLETIKSLIQTIDPYLSNSYFYPKGIGLTILSHLEEICKLMGPTDAAGATGGKRKLKTRRRFTKRNRKHKHKHSRSRN